VNVSVATLLNVYMP